MKMQKDELHMRSANSTDLRMLLCAEESTFLLDWPGETSPAKTNRSRAQKVQINSTTLQALNSLLTRFPCLIAKFFARAFPRDFARVKGRLLTSHLVNRKEPRLYESFRSCQVCPQCISLQVG